MIERRKSVGFGLVILTFNLMLLLHYAFVLLLNKYIAEPSFALYEGVGLFFNKNKIHELMVYSMDVVALFCLFSSYMLRKDLIEKILKKGFDRMYICFHRSISGALVVVLLFVVLPLVNGIFGSQNSMASFYARFAGQALLLVVLWFSYFNLRENRFVISRFDWLNSNVVGILLLVICYAQLVSLVYDPLVHRPKLVNEYYAIPEQTMLEGKYVDNTKYLRRSIKSPVFYKYDVMAGDANSNVLKADGDYRGIVFHHISALGDLTADQLFHDKRDGSLAFNMSKPLDGMLWIEDPAAYKLITELSERNLAMQANDYPASLDEFLSKNKYELHQQVLSRFMLHHHNFVLSPVNELSLGKKFNEVGAQYGLGGAVIIKQILQFAGGVTLHGWLRLCYLFYLLYFALFILIVFSISRNILLTAIVFMLSMTVINYRGYDIILMPPGESPWRHMFDIVVMYMLYKYQNRQHIAWYVLAGLISVLSVYINPQIGMMILLAYVASTTLQSLVEKKRIAIVFSWSAIIAIAALLITFIYSSHDQLGAYYLKGVVGIRILYISIAVQVLIMLLGYVMLYRVMRLLNKGKSLAMMFLLFYCQALLFYVAWHFDVNGITSRFFIYTLTYVLLAYYSGFWEWLSIRTGGIAPKAIMVLVILFYGLSVGNVFGQMRKYQAIFKDHKSYDWNFERAKITSTINPIFFQESVKMIDKYSRGVRGIYIISKYDNILPFVSCRYSEMPFQDLSWFLITEKEVADTVTHIKKGDPEYLYVDTDIYRNFNNDIIDERIPEIGRLSKESIWRVQRLKLLNRVYEGVADDYTLKEQGVLISVYKKNKP
jgi:hypothetical protein